MMFAWAAICNGGNHWVFPLLKIVIVRKSIANAQKTVKDRAKIFSPLFFFYFFTYETGWAKLKKIQLLPVLKNVTIFRRNTKSDKFERAITSLFFVQFSSTKAQINRLDERNPLVSLFFWYLENWIKSYFLLFIGWVLLKMLNAPKTAGIRSKIFAPWFFSVFRHLKPPERTWFSKKAKINTP